MSIRLQELINQLEAIRLQFSGNLEVTIDADGENLLHLDAIATPRGPEGDNDRIVVLTSFERRLPESERVSAALPCDSPRS